MMESNFATAFEGDTADFSAAILMREADHRIANNLSVIAGLIRLELRKMSDAVLLSSSEVRTLLENVSARIGSVARLHRLLHRSEGKTSVDVGEYLEEVVDAVLFSINNNHRIDHVFAVPMGCVLTPTAAAGLGLFVCEAITNAVKYSHPGGVHGQISVSAEVVGDGLRVEVADDGVGFPENFDSAAPNGDGMSIMSALASQVGGTLSFDSSPLGLTVRLDVPGSIIQGA